MRTKFFLRFTFGSALLILAGVALSGCSGSSSGGGGSNLPGSRGFQLTSISVRNNEVWQINRAIEFEFSQPVLFSSIGTDTISIKTPSGIPATGSFLQKDIDTDGDGFADAVDPTIIVWQPSCPILDDLSDAGLLAGGVLYELIVAGEDSTLTNSVLSEGGDRLRVTQLRFFRTPNSIDPSVIFIDPVTGDPIPLVRRVTGAGMIPMVLEGVSHVEIGNSSDPNARVFFERDNNNSANSVFPAGSVIPLNLYSDPGATVAVVLEINQPISPALGNISSDRLRLEYLGDKALEIWVPIETRVELIANCTRWGATVRLTPVGLLPDDTMLRAVIRSGFEGIVGGIDSTSSDQDLFGEVPIAEVDFDSLMNSADGADEYLEDFTVSGSGEASFEDTLAPFVVPRADWGEGRLEARFEFPGTGGPTPDFDWYVRDTLETFDTSSQLILGGPGGSQDVEQFTTGGVVQVRDFVIVAGAQLRVQGPNALVVNATGEIRIEGRLVASGFAGIDVGMINSGSKPEIGGAGAAGGGAGGNTSEVTNSSTPRGGTGFGPFGEPGVGGVGGESAFAVGGANNLNKDDRRPGGGGGGRFNRNQDDSTARSQQNLAAAKRISQGMRAQFGRPGAANSTGAVTGLMPAGAGTTSPGAFLDADIENNFFGIKPDVEITIPVDGSPPLVGPLMGLIRGELTGFRAGYGGGGGGDAIPAASFPNPNWTSSTDEKGGGGGGGGGCVNLRALGPIRFLGDLSRIVCRGGSGGLGENLSFFDHLGGTGGTGSGGHVILESASHIEFGGLVSQARRVFIDARGGAGKLGPPTDGNGGAIPVNVSYGGQGGPGLIQLHVPDPISAPQPEPPGPNLTDIVLPPNTLQEVDAGDANILLEVMRPAGVQMIANFSGRSMARTRWIDLGAAAVDPDNGGVADIVDFLFRGTDTSTGRVLTMNGVVPEQLPLLGPEAITGTVAIQSDGLTLDISGTSLDPIIAPAVAPPISNDLYLRTPSLLRNFTLRLADNVGALTDFVIQSAVYDNAALRLSVTVAPVGTATLASFLASATLPVSYTIIPRFLTVATDGVRDALPDTVGITITFDAAQADPNGVPDTNTLLLQGSTDVNDFNSLLPSELRFFRINYEFDLNAMGQGLSENTPTVELDLFRLPFVF